ncbi:MAG: hypothetical protein IT373_18335 [Polyangiaceae bacterium]|nr:hypothetical protein [Polyangiaceae bacterium]
MTRPSLTLLTASLVVALTTACGTKGSTTPDQPTGSASGATVSTDASAAEPEGPAPEVPPAP